MPGHSPSLPIGKLSSFCSGSKSQLWTTIAPHPSPRQTLPYSAHLKCFRDESVRKRKSTTKILAFILGRDADYCVRDISELVCCSQDYQSCRGRAHLVYLPITDILRVTHSRLQALGRWLWLLRQGGGPRRPHSSTTYSNAHTYRWWGVPCPPKKSGSYPGDGMYGVLEACLP